MKSSLTTVNKYFAGWLNANKYEILNSLNDDVYIEECYGPCYNGKKEVERWLNHWFAEGRVVTWNITEEWCLEKADTYFCKWDFSCEYKNKIDTFRGMSIIIFDENHKIKHLEEYQTTFEHAFPFK